MRRSPLVVVALLALVGSLGWSPCFAPFSHGSSSRSLAGPR